MTRNDRLNLQIIDASERVLRSWQGTPEELGETLEVATSPPWGLDPVSMFDDCEKRATARKRLLACDGGRELYELEMKSRRG